MFKLDLPITALRKRVGSKLRSLFESFHAALGRQSVADLTVTSPRWLSADGKARLVRWANTGRHDVYLGCMKELKFFGIDPPWTFSAVEFELVGTEWTEWISIEAKFTTVDDTIVTREARYKTGENDYPKKIPVHLSAGLEAQRVEVSFDTGASPPTLGQRLAGQLEPSNRHVNANSLPWPTLPTVDRTESNPLILFVSIDSLRHDRRYELDPIIAALGDRAVVPEEPRTQGHATQESHGSTFTSLHPGSHGLPHGSALPTDIPTLPEYLMEAGYKCSACVSTSNLSPLFGFGRGFHRYERQEMSWHDRAYDLESQIETVRRWMDRDRIDSVGNRFYFLHCFDAHYPYVPPFPLSSELDIDNDLGNRILEVAASVNAIDMRRNVTIDEIDLDESEFETMLEYYDASVRSVATRLAGLFKYLDREGALEEALVVVAGDHGEAFLERGSLFHNSLYDENIRPGMIVKPPASSDIVVPDTSDLIDLYPTVASLVSGDIPDHCQGKSWNGAREQDYRVTERVRDHHYQLAVEKDGRKGIFTWEVSEPIRPNAEIEVDVSNEEFSIPRASRQGATEKVESVRQNELREIAKSFVRREPSIVPSGSDNLPTDVVERLEHLGYR